MVLLVVFSHLVQIIWFFYEDFCKFSCFCLFLLKSSDFVFFAIFSLFLLLLGIFLEVLLEFF